MRNLIACCFFVLALETFGQTRSNDWIDVTRENVDTASLDATGKNLLDDPEFKWLHAHTTHFVIHFEQKMFAAKVARQAEFYYNFIGQDLRSAKDREENRSHIFIFRDEKDWKHFITEYDISMEWAFSMVRNMTMYLQQSDSKELNSNILGHEMTHLVFNRFYPAHIPMWLNEGSAEWYGEFAYSAFKGVKKSKRQVFRDIKIVYPIEQLVTMTTYPADRQAVSAFYQTSKFLVGFLQLNYPPDKFEPFLSDMAGGIPVEAALQKHYGIASAADLSAQFRRFIR